MLSFLLPYAIASFLLVSALLALLIVSYRAVRPGTALVLIDAAGRERVLLDGGAMLLPGRGAAHAIDLLPRTVRLGFDGDRALSLVDGRRVTFVFVASLRVDATADAVRGLFDRFGAGQANDASSLAGLVEGDLRSSLAAVAAGLDAGASAETLHERLVAAIPARIGTVCIEDAAVDALAVSPA